jgi:hypothetical protein
MKFWIIAIVFSIFVLLISCEGVLDSTSDSKNTIIYSNSFETEEDLLDWQGITTVDLRDEAAPSAGKKSIYISGGCVIPHASVTLNSPGIDLSVSVQCYAKNLGIGGSIELHVGDKQITIIVEKDYWELYRCDETLIWKANQPLTIQLNCGGFVPSSMLVDQLQVIESF